MQIVIPMSGFGERFRRAGYEVPKPLIPVDGEPIISHVVKLFPGETDFLFICNQEHLDEPAYAMAKQLRAIAPTGRIVGIAPHKKGPIWTVLQAREFIRRDAPVFVNYCDFSCYWDWEDFKAFAAETQCAGAVPAYRGFHPHSLGQTAYAYMQAREGWVRDIQEKRPFTDRPMEEYASSGGYYFESGALCLEACDAAVEQDLNIGGEYYVSLAYKPLLDRGLRVAYYELQHFMQWGTPADLAEYKAWSGVFRRLAVDDARRARQSGAVLVPMAGYGKRFADAGYALPKPLIPVSGRPMAIQAARDLPDAPATRFVLRRDTPGLDDITHKLRTSFVGASLRVLDEGTEGQAITCRLGLAGLDIEAPLTIGACDNGMLYDTRAFEALMASGGPDVLVWVVRGHADGQRRPQMFGWADADAEGRVRAVRVKEAPQNPAADPMIVGAFSFRRAADFNRACERLIARDGRVSGEFYVDSLIADALALGLECQLFEIDHYLGWGTPNDLKTFEYWQSCFHKWPSHPYRLELDRRVPPARVGPLVERFQPIKPARPHSPSRDRNAQATNGLAGESARFTAIGAAAVAIDLLAYVGLTATGLATSPAKATSFVAGALVAFLGNRYFTFRRRSGRRGFLLFWLVYASSLALNVWVNAEVKLLLEGVRLPASMLVAFVVATGVSAATNFVGMKLFVFRGEKT